jgi:hypothetical protein
MNSKKNKVFEKIKEVYKDLAVNLYYGSILNKTELLIKRIETFGLHNYSTKNIDNMTTRLNTNIAKNNGIGTFPNKLLKKYGDTCEHILKLYNDIHLSLEPNIKLTLKQKTEELDTLIKEYLKIMTELDYYLLEDGYIPLEAKLKSTTNNITRLQTTGLQTTGLQTTGLQTTGLQTTGLQTSIMNHHPMNVNRSIQVSGGSRKRKKSKGMRGGALGDLPDLGFNINIIDYDNSHDFHIPIERDCDKNGPYEACYGLPIDVNQSIDYMSANYGKELLGLEGAFKHTLMESVIKEGLDTGRLVMFVSSDYNEINTHINNNLLQTQDDQYVIQTAPVLFDQGCFLSYGWSPNGENASNFHFNSLLKVWDSSGGPRGGVLSLVGEYISIEAHNMLSMNVMTEFFTKYYVVDDYPILVGNEENMDPHYITFSKSRDMIPIYNSSGFNVDAINTSIGRGMLRNKNGMGPNPQSLELVSQFLEHYEPNYAIDIDNIKENLIKIARISKFSGDTCQIIATSFIPNSYLYTQDILCFINGVKYARVNEEGNVSNANVFTIRVGVGDKITLYYTPQELNIEPYLLQFDTIYKYLFENNEITTKINTFPNDIQDAFGILQQRATALRETIKTKGELTQENLREITALNKLIQMEFITNYINEIVNYEQTAYYNMYDGGGVDMNSVVSAIQGACIIYAKQQEIANVFGIGFVSEIVEDRDVHAYNLPRMGESETYYEGDKKEITVSIRQLKDLITTYEPFKKIILNSESDLYQIPEVYKNVLDIVLEKIEKIIPILEQLLRIPSDFIKSRVFKDRIRDIHINIKLEAEIIQKLFNIGYMGIPIQLYPIYNSRNILKKVHIDIPVVSFAVLMNESDIGLVPHPIINHYYVKSKSILLQYQRYVQVMDDFLSDD